MNLVDFKEWFKIVVLDIGDGISIGKIDSNLEKTICIYNSKRQIPKINAVGGEKNHTYGIKPITILIRWTQNASNAEIKANEIYDCLKNNRFFYYLNKKYSIELMNENPLILGTDDKNVYEYSIEINLYYGR